MTRVIIAGGRDFGKERRTHCKWRIANAMEQLFTSCGDGEAPDWRGFVVLSGMADGADRLGHEWAAEKGITVEEYPADWTRFGKRAGFLRNMQMAEQADALVAFWDGESKGTRHMIETALKYGLEVHVYRYDPIEETF